MKSKSSRKKAHKKSLCIRDSNVSHRIHERELKARRKGKPIKKPPNRWFSKRGPCDNWVESRGRVHVPLKRGPKRKLVRDGAEYVSNSVQEPKGKFMYHKLGIYLEGSYLSEKLVTKLRPAFNKACRYFRPYIGDGNFAMAIRLCVHFGFTTKRIRSLLRIGDLYRRGKFSQYRIHIQRWIGCNFSRKERRKVVMDFNITLAEELDCSPGDIRNFDSDTESGDTNGTWDFSNWGAKRGDYCSSDSDSY